AVGGPPLRRPDADHAWPSSRRVRDQVAIAGRPRLDLIRANDESLDRPSRAARWGIAAEQRASDALGLDPNLLGAGDLGDRLRRAWYLLAMRQLDLRVAQYLITQPARDPVVVDHLLRYG